MSRISYITSKKGVDLRNDSKMSVDIVISVENAVLSYPVRALTPTSIKSFLLSPFGARPDSLPEFFEVLRGISFQVRRGERVGIVGHNGAGKSTLLRAIAGIYPLQSGSIRVNGEVRGLYDLGAGFEVEDTGRENIYLRGHLLGYTREEVADMEEEIIRFAGLEGFIDMPLRTYSAGMQVRLAFAISTAMGGGVLLIDEVLAAGDAEFAEKARARMCELIDTAQCMVLVSHDMGAVTSLCTRVLWIDQGRIQADGEPEEVVNEYLKFMHGENDFQWG